MGSSFDDKLPAPYSDDIRCHQIEIRIIKCSQDLFPAILLRPPENCRKMILYLCINNVNRSMEKFDGKVLTIRVEINLIETLHRLEECKVHR